MISHKKMSQVLKLNYFFTKIREFFVESGQSLNQYFPENNNFTEMHAFFSQRFHVQSKNHHKYMSHFASACKTEGQNGISRLISELLHTLDSSLREPSFRVTE